MLEAQRVHGSLIKSGLHAHIFKCNLLLLLYVSSGFLQDAHRLLLSMPASNAVSWNTVLSGYVKSRSLAEALQFFRNMPEVDTHSHNSVISCFTVHGCCSEAIAHFSEMRRSCFSPDRFTYSTILTVCGFEVGRQIHGLVFKSGVDHDVFTAANLVKLYVDYERLGDAYQVFVEVPIRDVVVWNALISGFSRNGRSDVSFNLFKKMLGEGMLPDAYTFASLLDVSAGQLAMGKAVQLHALIIRFGISWDLFVANCLLHFYSKCESVMDLVKVFSEMRERNIVSWSILLATLAQSGFENKSVELFHEMESSGIKPNSFIFVGVLGACARMAALDRGKQVHGHVLSFGMELDVITGSAIIDMYAKCGEMDSALKLFSDLNNKDVVPWNGMISGYAQCGMAEKALQLFEEMKQLGTVKPNEITFVALLSACSHGGLLQEGCRYFESMVSDHGIEPIAEHYACIVDLFGRAGLLKDAGDFVLSMPFDPDSVIWTALLGACRKHGNIRMARNVAGHALACEQNSSSYVLLSNMYYGSGRWTEGLEARLLMDRKGAKKMTGRSWINVRGRVHSFTASDNSHPQVELDGFGRCHQVMLPKDTLSVDLNLVQLKGPHTPTLNHRCSMSQTNSSSLD
ncbi:Pentatricopeptide repeat-containing protein [Nymphaea thermarum]|nr:Pentatricopeptide repeat-containing protein [Nymphaea thermarum]